MANRSIKIAPGVPGMEGFDPGGGRNPYPETTIDVVKMLRQAGFDVEFDDQPSERAYVGRKALEVWLPILEVAANYLLSMSSGLATWLITDYLSKRAGERESEALLHVTYRIVDENGQVHEITLHGLESDVSKSLNEFEGRFTGGSRIGEPKEGEAVGESGPTNSNDRRSDERG